MAAAHGDGAHLTRPAGCVIMRGMEPSFLGVPGIDAWVFGGLAAFSFVTAFIASTVGTAGGLVLLAVMAIWFPPAVLIPVHTVVMLGSSSSLAAMRWRYVLKGTLLPFALGAAMGALAGAQIFVTLSAVVLQGILGVAILVLAWMPGFAQFGPERGRFAVLGFAMTFLGIFVSATGSLLAPFVAGSTEDRRYMPPTLSFLMTVVHVAKLAAFGALGLSVGAWLPLIAAMIAVSILGNFAGSRILDRVPERAFRAALKIVLTGLAIRLLWVTAVEAGLV